MYLDQAVTFMYVFQVNAQEGLRSLLSLDRGILALSQTSLRSVPTFLKFIPEPKFTLGTLTNLTSIFFSYV